MSEHTNPNPAVDTPQQEASNKRGTKSSACILLYFSSSNSDSVAPSSSKSKAARSEWQDDEHLTRSVVQKRNDDRAARKVHSSKPMFLSRRQSMKINKAAESDLIHSYSPLASCRLTFVPSSCVIRKIRRGASSP